jgi:hypothetical protein
MGLGRIPSKRLQVEKTAGISKVKARPRLQNFELPITVTSTRTYLQCDHAYDLCLSQVYVLLEF